MATLFVWERVPGLHEPQELEALINVRLSTTWVRREVEQRLEDECHQEEQIDERAKDLIFKMLDHANMSVV